MRARFSQFGLSVVKEVANVTFAGSLGVFVNQVVKDKLDPQLWTGVISLSVSMAAYPLSVLQPTLEGWSKRCLSASAYTLSQASVAAAAMYTVSFDENFSLEQAALVSGVAVASSLVYGLGQRALTRCASSLFSKKDEDAYEMGSFSRDTETHSVQDSTGAYLDLEADERRARMEDRKWVKGMQAKWNLNPQAAADKAATAKIEERAFAKTLRV